ncbi:hypothetical protein ACF090_25665 [Streptomyces sp. NPDC014892]
MQGAHAPAFEEGAGGEADRPAADDQDRHFGMHCGHVGLLPLTRVGRRAR